MQHAICPGIYLECIVRGVRVMVERGSEGRTSVPHRGPGARPRCGLGAKPPEAIGTMKYCAYKNWFLCIIFSLLLKHALKLKRHTVQLCNQTGSDGYFRDDVPCLGGLYNILYMAYMQSLA